MAFIKRERTHSVLKKTNAEILLQPNIVKPLHGMNPRTILGRKWWDVERKKAYESTGFHCLACGVHKENAMFHNWLEAHEEYSINFDKHEYKLNKIVPLCHACHNFIHDGRLSIILDKGEITERKYGRIIGHGNLTLARSNLPGRHEAWWTDAVIYKQMFPELVGTWDKWHIVIDSKKYYSKFKDFSEWKDFYSR